MDLAQQQVNQIIKKMEKGHQIIEEDGQNIILAAGLFFTYGQEALCLMSGVYENMISFSTASSAAALQLFISCAHRNPSLALRLSSIPRDLAIS